MIVDHRVYTLHPGKLKAFVQLYAEKGWPLQQQYLGDCVGWYTSMDIGQLNQVVHIWRYESLADLERKRAARDADPDWAAFQAQTEGCLMMQDNKIMRPASFSPSA